MHLRNTSLITAIEKNSCALPIQVAAKCQDKDKHANEDSAEDEKIGDRKSFPSVCRCCGFRVANCECAVGKSCFQRIELSDEIDIGNVLCCKFLLSVMLDVVGNCVALRKTSFIVNSIRTQGHFPTSCVNGFTLLHETRTRASESRTIARSFRIIELIALGARLELISARDFEVEIV